MSFVQAKKKIIQIKSNIAKRKKRMN